MKDAPIPGHETLGNLLNNLRAGRYAIPDFQRDFEWEPWDINELVKSVFRDYYIGNLLLWRGKTETFEALSCESIYGFSGSEARSHIVLDGQQRLTALHYAFIAPDVPAPKRTNRYLYFLRVDRFMDEDFDKAFEYIWTRYGTNLLREREEQFRTHMFPISIVGTPGFALPNWLQDYHKYWEYLASNGLDDDQDVAKRFVAQASAFTEFMEQLTQQYHIAHIELDRDIALDKVCDIFTQINSRGVRLDIFDLLNALLRPKGLRLRQELWRNAEPRLAFVGSDRMNIYVLQVMSILLQNYCSPKYLYYLIPGAERQVREASGALTREVLMPDTETFEQWWGVAVDALERAITLLKQPQEYGAIAPRFLPYASILPAFAAIQSEARRLPPMAQLSAQQKIKAWYWASIFNSRYSGSVESTAARDYIDMKQWFGDDAAEPSLVEEFRQSVASLPLARESRRGSSIYNGLFNLLILNEARDWLTGIMPNPDMLDDHHIVPQSWGRARPLDTSIDTILNRTPLSGETNRWISDRLPNEYLPKLIEESGERTVRDIFASHYISPAAFEILLREDFGSQDFEAFCNERLRTFREAIDRLHSS